MAFTVNADSAIWKLWVLSSAIANSPLDIILTERNVTRWTPLSTPSPPAGILVP